MRDEERIFSLEIVQILQNRLALVRETVVPTPFQITDLHGDLREFEGVGIQLDRFELLHVDARFELEAELGGKGDEFLFKIEKQLKRDVKKVAAATGGIEHSNGGEFVVKRGEFRAIGRFAFTTHERRLEFALDLAPFTAQRRHQHRLD